MPDGQLTLAILLHFSGTVGEVSSGELTRFWEPTEKVLILGKYVFQTVKKDYET